MGRGMKRAGYNSATAKDKWKQQYETVMVQEKGLHLLLRQKDQEDQHHQGRPVRVEKKRSDLTKHLGQRIQVLLLNWDGPQLS